MSDLETLQNSSGTGGPVRSRHAGRFARFDEEDARKVVAHKPFLYSSWFGPVVTACLSMTSRRSTRR